MYAVHCKHAIAYEEINLHMAFQTNEINIQHTSSTKPLLKIWKAITLVNAHQNMVSKTDAKKAQYLKIYVSMERTLCTCKT